MTSALTLCELVLNISDKHLKDFTFTSNPIKLTLIENNVTLGFFLN